jgi:hypothetical protein
MNKLIAILILLSFFPIQAYAAVIKDFDPMENDLLSQPDAKPSERENQRLNEDFQKQIKKIEESTPAQVRSEGSNWWKWTLGILVVGGVAAAAGGKSGGGNSSSAPPTVSGTVTTGW